MVRQGVPLHQAKEIMVVPRGVLLNQAQAAVVRMQSAEIHQRVVLFVVQVATAAVLVFQEAPLHTQVAEAVL